MDGYTMVGGSRIDLKPWDQTKMQNVALHLYRHNHMAKRLLEIIIDFCLGDGLQVSAVHDNENTEAAIQDVLDAFWNDPINDMNRYNAQRLTELNLWGEILMPVTVNGLGDVRLGWIDPVNIYAIEPDAVTKRPGRIELSDQAANEVGKKFLEVIRYSQSEDMIVGDAFYHSINTVATGRRGVSEYFSSADWFDVYDETMKTSADRSKVMLQYIWDVTLDGASDAEIKEFLKAQKPPKPNSIRAHNEKVKWEAKSPNLGAHEASRHLKDLKHLIIGGFGYPAHWFGAGDDANLATAEVMAEPTRKALRRKMRQYTYLLSDILRFVIVQKISAGKLLGVDPLRECFKIDTPDIGGSDVAKIGAALQQITAAVTMAVDNALVTEDTGRAIFAAIAGMTGIDVDPIAEKNKLDAEQDKKSKDDQAKRADEVMRMNAMLMGVADAKQPVSPGGEDV